MRKPLGHVAMLGRLMEGRGKEGQNNFLILRLFAALLVIVGHSFALAPRRCGACVDPLRAIGAPVPLHGFGVLVFFAISGFLIVRSALTHDAAFYLRSRLLRIVPGLAVCAILMAFIVGPIATSLPWDTYFSASEPYSYVARVVLFFRQVPFELPGVGFTTSPNGRTVNGSLWTIPLEVRLYIIALLTGLCVKRFHIPALAAIGAWVLISALVDLSVVVPNEDGYRLSWMFALGAAAYSARHWLPMHGSLLALLAFAWFVLRETPVGSLVFLLATTYGTLYVAFLPRLRLPGWIEDCSYGIYLYGFPIQQLLGAHFVAFGPFRMMVVAIPIAWVIGMASWRWVEQPCLRLKRIPGDAPRAA